MDKDAEDDDKDDDDDDDDDAPPPFLLVSLMLQNMCSNPGTICQKWPFFSFNFSVFWKALFKDKLCLIEFCQPTSPFL